MTRIAVFRRQHCNTMSKSIYLADNFFVEHLFSSARNTIQLYSHNKSYKLTSHNRKDSGTERDNFVKRSIFFMSLAQN